MAHDGPALVDAVVNRTELAMLPSITLEMLVEQRQQRRERRADVTDDAEIDGGTAADVLRPEVDLRNADAGPLGIELAIGKVGPEHLQDVAVAHRVIAGREADQPGHADVVKVLPLDMLLAAERVDHRRLEALA